MLIVTNRHTKSDLEAWRDYEEVDELSYYSFHKHAQSVDVILRWFEDHGDVVAYTSWGKDSIVLLNLIAFAGISVPVVFMRFTDRDNPDCELVRDAYLAENDLNYHEEIFEYAAVRKTGAHWDAIAKKWGLHRLTGLRNDESGKRQLQWRLNGFESQYSCRPLALWTNAEIFTYIHHSNLPLSPVYGYLGGGRYQRERLRTHSLAGSSGNGMGRTEWEREYYPDVLARIAARKI